MFDFARNHGFHVYKQKSNLHKMFGSKGTRFYFTLNDPNIQFNDFKGDTILEYAIVYIDFVIKYHGLSQLNIQY